MTRSRRAADLARSRRLRALTSRTETGQRRATLVIDGEKEQVNVGRSMTMTRSILERLARREARRETLAFVKRIRAIAPTLSRDIVLSTIKSEWPVEKSRPRSLDDDEVRRLFDAFTARGDSHRVAWRGCAERFGCTEGAIRASLKRSARRP